MRKSRRDQRLVLGSGSVGFAGGDHGEHGVGEHDQRRVAVPGGPLADLVLVEGDPSTDISDVRRCRTVFKNGSMFDSAKLYAAAGILPAK